MALSARQREAIKEENRLIESLINPNKVTYSKVNEGKGLYDLDEIEKLLGDKTFNYNKPSEFINSHSSESTVDISLLLFSNKNTNKVDKDKNLLSYSFDFQYTGNNGTVDVYKEGYRESCGINEFWGLPDNSFKEGNTEGSVNSFIKQCDFDSIYNLYSNEAVKGMRLKFPTAHSLFTGGNLYTMKKYDDNVTLFVAYDHTVGKFVYCYNPKMILRTAIEEYTQRKYCYPSLTACYIYLLTFFISHEMMHIVVNNTVSQTNTNETNLGSHAIENVCMDGFINSEVAKRLRGFAGTGFARGKESPIPNNGIGTIISMRSQHNVGLRHFEDEESLVRALYSVLAKKLDIDSKLDINSYLRYPVSDIAGADFIVNIRVPSGLERFRKSSGIFQNLIGDVFKTLSEGVASVSLSMSETEKATDANVFPVGTMVRIRNTTTVCYIKSYDDEGMYAGTYTLTYADRDGVDRTALPDGSILCKYKYKDSEREAGYYKRNQIILFDPNSEENTYVEGGQTQQEPDKLSQEDLDSIKNQPQNIVDFAISKYGEDTVREKLAQAIETLQIKLGQEAVDYAKDLMKKCKGVDDGTCYNTLTKEVYNRFKRYMKELENNKAANKKAKEQKAKDLIEKIKKEKGITDEQDKQIEDMLKKMMGQGQPPKPKVIKIGTYVYVKALRKFGVVTAVNGDGTFRVSEVIEGKPVILDDSNNH